MSETVITLKSLELSYGDAKYFREILKALEIFAAEVPVTVNREGLISQFMDPSHVLMCKLEIPREAFDTLYIEGSRTICLNIEDVVKKVFKNVYTGDMVKLAVNTEQATFSLLGDMKRDFKAALLEPTDEETPPEPKIDHKFRVKMVLRALERILKDAVNIAENVIITGLNDGVIFDAKAAYEGTEYHAGIDHHNENILRVSCRDREPQKASFSLDYLSSIIKALKPLVDVVELSFSTDMPLKLKADLRDCGAVTFWMAPRVQPGG